MTTGYAQRNHNDTRGLIWVHKFCWLRSVELGRLMWPDSAFSRTRADRVIRGWATRKLIIVRKLPDGAGRAVVLAEAGARLLYDAGVKAKSGKEWGEISHGTWQPPQDWRHDLISAGVLTLLYEQGLKILPEPEIRRENYGLIKVPDGLAWLTNDRVYWLETERISKTGGSLKELAKALNIVSEGTSALISEHRATIPLVCYALDAQDDRGLAINHKTRVYNAIRRTAERDVTVCWAACAMIGYGVSAVTLSDECITADLTTRILGVLNAGGWDETDDVFVGHYGAISATIWNDGVHGWSYQLEGPGCPAHAEIANTKTGAKHGCANLIAIMKNKVGKQALGGGF